ncbi:DUF3558 domain-containing protein [Nocardia miyunensis]|uniref:DUF3558 domain-containing protein n=1 Tax=Nocardia miyunensis TaxID=282684 RepID=UPI00082AC3B1|nr:DUF3558 domain-containing protein [Nocardia miyunensis]
MRAVGRMLIAVMLAAGVAGCSSGGTPQSQSAPADDPNILAGCGPLSDQALAGQLKATSVRRQSAPTTCTWIARTPSGTVDISYSWFSGDVLMREMQVAAQYGYRTEKVVVERFGGMYWRDPRDPSSCGVTTADTGTVTWWVQNRDHAAQPDPCAAAMNLLRTTLAFDGI